MKSMQEWLNLNVLSTKDVIRNDILIFSYFSLMRKKKKLISPKILSKFSVDDWILAHRSTMPISFVGHGFKVCLYVQVIVQLDYALCCLHGRLFFFFWVISFI